MNPTLPDMGGFTVDLPPTHYGSDMAHLPIAWVGEVPRTDMGSAFPYKSPIDGLAWSPASGIVSSNWTFPCYGGGIATCVQGGGTTLGMRSLDKGRSWLPVVMPGFGSSGWKNVTYGNGFFVFTAGNNSQANVLGVSADALNILQGALPSTQFTYGISFGGGRFVIVCNTSNVAFVSTVGVTMPDMVNLGAAVWSTATLPSSASWRAVRYGINDVWVAVGNPNSMAISYDNGLNWVAGPTLSVGVGNMFDVRYGGGIWVIPISGTALLFFASDPAGPWQSIATPTSNGGIYPLYLNGIWFVFDSTGSYFYSVDNFKTVSPSFSVISTGTQFAGVCAAEGALVVIPLAASLVGWQGLMV